MESSLNQDFFLAALSIQADTKIYHSNTNAQRGFFLWRYRSPVTSLKQFGSLASRLKTSPVIN